MKKTGRFSPCAADRALLAAAAAQSFEAAARGLLMGAAVGRGLEAAAVAAGRTLEAAAVAAGLALEAAAVAAGRDLPAAAAGRDLEGAGILDLEARVGRDLGAAGVGNLFFFDFLRERIGVSAISSTSLSS